MVIFALENIEAVVGKQQFVKLVVRGKAPFDEFEAGLESKFQSEMARIYACMNDVANLKSLPKEKFHFYDKAKGEHREFEFKSKHLRVYGITKPNGCIVILGGTKASRKQISQNFDALRMHI